MSFPGHQVMPDTVRDAWPGAYYLDPARDGSATDVAGRLVGELLVGDDLAPEVDVPGAVGYLGTVLEVLEDISRAAYENGEELDPAIAASCVANAERFAGIAGWKVVPEEGEA